MNTAQQRCRFLSHSRGIKEINYLLERFTEEVGDSVWSDPLYQELMAYDDISLWEALMQPQTASLPEHLLPLISRILATHTSAQD